MEQKELDVMEKEDKMKDNVLALVKADKGFVPFDFEESYEIVVRNMEYEVGEGVYTTADIKFAEVIVKVIENLPAKLKANLPKSVKKKLTEMDLEKNLKVQSNLRIETKNVLKKEGSEMHESDYEKMWHIRFFDSLDIAKNERCCIEEGLVDREKPVIKKLLRRWKDKRSKYVSSGKKFLVIKDYEDKLRKFRQGFQEYKRLSTITIRTRVVGKKMSIGDMVWRIRISLPEMDIKSVSSHGAENGQWELLTEDMDNETGGLSFEKAVERLNERVEREKNEG